MKNKKYNASEEELITVPHEKIGEGAFGCVLRPPVKCSNKEKLILKKKKVNGTNDIHKSNANMIGKVFVNKDSFGKELEMSKKAAKIDKSGTSLLVPKSSCNVNKEDVYKNKSANECKIFEEEGYIPGTMYQLVMPYGGERLDHTVHRYNDIYMKKFPINTFLNIIEPLFQGLFLFKKNKYCHQDIKPSNILVTPQHKAIYIDYGLMKPFNEIYSKTNRRLKYTYFPYPFEYKLFYYINIEPLYCVTEKKDKTIHDVCNLELYKNAIKNISKYDEYTKMYNRYFNKNELESILYNVIDRYRKLDEKNKLKKYLEKHIEKIDLYSIGIVFVHLEEELYIDSLSAKMYNTYNNFVRNLIHPDIEKRYTLKQAYKELKYLQKNINN